MVSASLSRESIMVWRIEIQIDQIWPPAGDETSSTNENHVILDGPQRREAATHRLCIQGPPKP